MARKTKSNPLGWGIRDSLRLARSGRPTLAFLWSPPGRAINNLLWRWKPYKSRIDRGVWSDLSKDKNFMDSLAKGKADSDAGRVYRYNPDNDNLPMVPKETWQPDDPQLPDGWHHDGEKWVLNEDGGWFADHSGYWRYNKPGEVGWQEQPNGSWKYSKEPTDAR